MIVYDVTPDISRLGRFFSEIAAGLTTPPPIKLPSFWRKS